MVLGPARLRGQYLDSSTGSNLYLDLVPTASCKYVFETGLMGEVWGAIGSLIRLLDHGHESHDALIDSLGAAQSTSNIAKPSRQEQFCLLDPWQRSPE